jgi:L-erythro-3,5-diaminohexanoate dehydrogenase
MTDWDLDPRTLGSWRALEPRGALLHLAERIDAESDANDHELALDVDLLHVDATSYAQIARSCDHDPDRMAARLGEVVAARGALQNPETRSGGVGRGRVTHVGPRSAHGAAVGDLVVPLVSLIALPLRLDAVGPLDPGDPEVPVRGRAIVTGRMPVLVVPDDLADVALTAADVYPVASYAHTHARPGDHVAVLGGGVAGALAAAAALEVVGEHGEVTVVDVDGAALARVALAAPAALTVRADARDAVAVAERLRVAGRRPADLTFACTSARGCEGTALLVTATDGVVLYFSTATSFAAASLGTDPIGHGARLELSNGVTPDHGALTLDLLRRNPALRAQFAGRTD